MACRAPRYARTGEVARPVGWLDWRVYDLFTWRWGRVFGRRPDLLRLVVSCLALRLARADPDAARRLAAGLAEAAGPSPPGPPAGRTSGGSAPGTEAPAR